jgi:hypothetical protein
VRLQRIFWCRCTPWAAVPAEVGAIIPTPFQWSLALAKFFEQNAKPGPSDGLIADWSDGVATAHGRLLTVAAIGRKPSDGDLSLTVAHQGEGQTLMPFAMSAPHPGLLGPILCRRVNLWSPTEPRCCPGFSVKG